MKDIALENKSYQEAAKEARITRDAYKKRVERARKFLKEKIKEK
jgi:DNA-directed RNA polymerase specialized sigma24 family protein